MKNILFNVKPDFQFTASQEDPGRLPTFEMLAYTGADVDIFGWENKVVVNTAGVDVTVQKIPVRVNHGTYSGIGHTTSIKIEDNFIIATGVVSRDTRESKEFVTSAKNGFPWQASIGGMCTKCHDIEEGQTETVNGAEIPGPATVIDEMKLYEISIVDLGADSNTEVTVKAKRDNNNTELKMSEKETLNEEPFEKQEIKNTVNQGVNDYINEIRMAASTEVERVAKITELAGGKCPKLEVAAIKEGWTPERFELEMLRELRPAAPAPAAERGPANKNVLEAIALGSSGISTRWMEKRFDAQTLEAADKYRGIGIQEFCEIACGKPLPRFRRDAGGWLQAAFSTASLPGLLSNIANKMLLEGYNYVEDAWKSVCKIGTVTDFKEHTRYRMTGSFKFEKIGPGGEFQHGELGEQKFTQRADTRGIMFAITRQMIIDDDLGAFTDIPRQIGIAAAEAIAESVWSLFLSNPTQSDNKTFFHANHGNLITGNTTALSVNGLTEAEIKFGDQTKPNGYPLGVMPSILLVPISLKVAAEQLMNSLTLNDGTASPTGAANPHAGKYNVVSSAYLNNSSFTGYSAKAWYLLADPNRLPSMEVAFLGGLDRPTIERADADFSVLGVNFRGYLDYGVKEQDYRGALKAKGEV